MSVEENKTLIKNFLRRAFRDYDLQDNEDIFSLGFVNSLFAMELVMFVEKTFSITIEDEDLTIENFSTVNNIASLIEHKAGHSA